MRPGGFGVGMALGAGIFFVASACIPDAILRTDAQGGAGGQGGVVSGPTTSAGAEGGSTVSTSSSIGCTQPSDCPGVDTTCRQRACERGICDFEVSAANVPCADEGGQVCDGEGACVECTIDAHCQEPPCTNNVCGIKAELGDACDEGADCVSGQCADGVCCDSACSGPCEACVAITTCQPDGQCSNIAAGTDPDDECNAAQACFGGSCQIGKVVFTTSAIYTGSMGGLTGADQICATHAAAGCLGGTFMAWLSTAQESPSTRFTQSTVPYRRVDGVSIATNYNDLIDGALDAPNHLDELGNPAPVSNIPAGCLTDLAYSGTAANGTALEMPENRCNEWTSTAADGLWGRFGASTSNWTDYCNGTSGNTCALKAAIYCFEQ